MNEVREIAEKYKKTDRLEALNMKTVVILLMSLQIVSCTKWLYKDYRDNSYFKIKGGDIYFVQGTKPNDTIIKCYEKEQIKDHTSNSSFKPLFLKLSNTFNSLDTSKNLHIAIQFNELKYYLSGWDEYPFEGSAEKILKFEFFLKNHDKIYDFTRHNHYDTLTKNAIFILDSLETTKLDLISGGYNVFKSCHPLRVKDINSVEDFVLIFNNRPKDFYAMKFETLIFSFDKKLFESLNFEPIDIEIRLTMKLPSNKRSRIISINKSLSYPMCKRNI